MFPGTKSVCWMDSKNPSVGCKSALYRHQEVLAKSDRCWRYQFRSRIVDIWRSSGGRRESNKSRGSSRCLTLTLFYFINCWRIENITKELPRSLLWCIYKYFTEVWGYASSGTIRFPGNLRFLCPNMWRVEVWEVLTPSEWDGECGTPAAPLSSSIYSSAAPDIYSSPSRMTSSLPAPRAPASPTGRRWWEERPGFCSFTSNYRNLESLYTPAEKVALLSVSAHLWSLNSSLKTFSATTEKLWEKTLMFSYLDYVETLSFPLQSDWKVLD